MSIKKLVAAAIVMASIATFSLVAPAPQANAGTACTQSTFRSGSTDKCVKYIQTILNTCAKNIGNCYYNLSPNGAQLTEDGIYGPKTTSTVKVFQQYYGMGSLTVDGVVGPKTWGKLCTAMGMGVMYYGQNVAWTKGINAARWAGCNI